MISQLSNFLNLSEKSIENLFYTIFTILLFIVIRIVTSSIIRRNIKDEKRSYNLRKTFTYVYSALLIYAISSVWLNGMQSIGTFLGLTSAGLAIALHDTIANLAGFIFIETRKPFRVGDRVEINGHQGDVIDIRLFQFSIVEVGNWVDADQSTGRIIHVPNNMVLKHPTANSHVGFEYIWNEVPYLTVFPSSSPHKIRDFLTKSLNMHRQDVTRILSLAEGSRSICFHISGKPMFACWDTGICLL